MSWIIYGGIAILMIYMMTKGGGCCGGGHASHGGHQGGGCCGGGMNHSGHQGHNEGYKGNAVDASEGMVQDPVCGMYVSKRDAISREINGRIFYFCSRNCADEFERNHAV